MSNPENLPVSAPTYLPPAAAYSLNAPEAEAGAGGGQVLKRYLSALRRHKWLVLAVVALGTSGAVLASRYVPSRYVAEATLWFSAESRQGANQGPIQSTTLLRDDAWSELLRSFVVLDYVTMEEGLYIDARARDLEVVDGLKLDSLVRFGEYVLKVDDTGRRVDLATKDGIKVASAAVGQPLGRELGFVWTPARRALTPGREVPFTVITPREGSKLLNGKLQSRLARGGNFMSITYSGEDPERVAAVVNAVAERYVAVAAELKNAQLKELGEALESQLRTAEADLRSAELALQGFRVRTITLPTADATPVTPGLAATNPSVIGSYHGMKIERETLELQRDAIARALPSGPGGTLSVDELSVVPAVRESPELGQALNELASKRAALRVLAQTFTPLHPQMQRAQAEVDQLEQVTIPALARAAMNQLEQRMQVMDAMVASTGSELKQIPPRVIDEARYARDVEIASANYNNVRQRYENTRLAAETNVPDVRILDRATSPQRPALDQRMQLILLGFAGSLGLGLLLSVILDRVDPKVRYAEQVTEELGLGVLGVVPNLGSRGALGAGSSEEASRVLEALRSIRLTLMHAYGSAGPVLVTVTSPGSGDGKTFVTSNLALSFADLGLRTLVIDGDTRRGGMHRIFGLDRKPGLTDYLAGEAELSEIVRPTKYPAVDLIPGGSRRANSPELLSSPRMGQLLAEIKAGYAVVLLDSPPLGAGVDPLVLATLCGNVILVMRTGKTQKAMARAKLEMLDRLPVRLLGTVLNGFDSVDSYRYYSYLPGYESHREDAASEKDSELLPSGAD